MRATGSLGGSARFREFVELGGLFGGACPEVDLFKARGEGDG